MTIKGRPNFTVSTKNGVNYDANHIRYARGTDGKYVISFLCSGQETTIAVNDVNGIIFLSSGAGWCGECDQPLPSDNYTDPECTCYESEYGHQPGCPYYRR